ncbi:MAG TPA: hypothetical protein VHY83_02190 [Solirubrobacteraceae bacterium]|nr:hypothetical protein [Solirubrobacteraceae bacterium]
MFSTGLMAMAGPASAVETRLEQGWEHGLKSEVPAPSTIDPLTGRADQWLVFSGGNPEAGGGASQGTQDTELVQNDEVAGWPAEDPFFGQNGVETKDTPVNDRHNLWHVQSLPQNISINPFITPKLVTLPPGDSGALPAPAGGKNVAWFGDHSSGTFCGTLKEVEENNAGALENGCETKQDPGEKPGGTTSTVQEGELVSPPFNLEGFTSAVLHFDSWFEIEAVDANFFDAMAIEYTTDAGTKAQPFTWHRLGELNPANNPGGAPSADYTDEGQNTPATWQPILVDLTEAAGKPNVRVRFVFDSWDYLFNGFRGWLIDNVRAASPSDAGTPQITSVEACAGTALAPVTVIHGNNFFVGSTVNIDGEPQPAQTPSSTRVEISQLSEGTHTIQLLSPNGGPPSNVFTVNATCVPPPPPPPPAPPPPPPPPVLVQPKTGLLPFKAALAAPVLGSSVNVEVVSGVVFVKLPPGAHLSGVARGGAGAFESLTKGVGFIPLSEARQIPVGSTLDTSGGVARLTSATATAGKTQVGEFGAGIFTILQDRKQRGLVSLNVVNAQPPQKVCATVGKKAQAARRLSSRVLGRLNGNAHGKYVTRGQYSAATVRGTAWNVINRCDGTLTQVTRGVVSVRDFLRRKTITLHAGQHYLAKAP